MPIRSSFNTSHHSTASRRSMGVRGATKLSSASERVKRGVGNARRLILPLGNSGSASISSTDAGTMYEGSLVFR